MFFIWKWNVAEMFSYSSLYRYVSVSYNYMFFTLVSHEIEIFCVSQFNIWIFCSFKSYYIIRSNLSDGAIGNWSLPYSCMALKLLMFIVLFFTLIQFFYISHMRKKKLRKNLEGLK